MRWLCTIVLALVFTSAVQAQDKPDVQIGLSYEVIEISSNFVGTNIVVFGSIENGDPIAIKNSEYDIVVVLVGPREEVVVRRKENRMGIWINGQSVAFNDVPSSYSVASTKPLSFIKDAENTKILQIGLDNLNVLPNNSDTPEDVVKTFRESLSRLKVSKNLYLERIGGVEFLSPTLFKASLAVPANVPIGKHTARAFLFRNGNFVNAQFSQMQVKKVGFEQFTYNLAHEHGLIFGIIAVLIAVTTGWLASVVFRKD